MEERLKELNIYTAWLMDNGGRVCSEGMIADDKYLQDVNTKEEELLFRVIPGGITRVMRRHSGSISKKLCLTLRSPREVS